MSAKNTDIDWIKRALSMYFEDRHLSTENFIHDAFKDDITLEGGLLAQECATLYVPPGADVPKDQQFNR
jgi:tRNA(adenine34) deaminase